MNHILKILLLIGILSSWALSSGCKSKEEHCKEQARLECFGETTKGKPKKYKGGQEYSCFDARYTACVGRE